MQFAKPEYITYAELEAEMMLAESKQNSMIKNSTVLIVDDEEDVHYSFRRFLSPLNCHILKATSGEDAIALLNHERPDLIIMDIKMGGMDGLATLKVIHEQYPHIPVIMMTAYSTTNSAIEATRLGAFDYLLKPFDPPQILEVIQQALSTHKMMQKSVVWGAEESDLDSSDVLVGNSPQMQDVYKLIGKVADSDALVLINGESGTGKELVARAIYSHSSRKKKIFLPINCAAIPETLLESELFGHEKGSFSGAYERRIGKFEQACSGTIFLDEIGELSPTTQSKLLRVLQEKTFQRVGGKEFIHTDVRIITATNRDLGEMVREGKFREDLYYRLQVLTVNLPPLRERRNDIPLLARYFARKAGYDSLPLSKDAADFLVKHEWPGNVRELENAIQRALLLSRGNPITVEQLNPAGMSISKIQPPKATEASEEDNEASADLSQALDRLWDRLLEQQESQKIKVFHWLEVELAKRAMAYTGNNQVRSAKLLGISRNTLRQRLGM